MTFSPHKYKIKVAQVLPARAEGELFLHKKSVLGVSMSNPVFWRSSLGNLLQWMDGNFADNMILVGDYLHRLNERVANGNNEAQAIETALDLGDQFMARLQPFLQNFEQNRFVVQRWQPFHQDPDFWKEMELMERLYRDNASIRASIDSTAALFIWQKQDRTAFQMAKEEAIRLSAQYLLEEMAVFSVLIDRGWDVVLYPGAQLPLLMEIATGRFKDVPISLHKGVYVELQVKK
jgi:tRNA-dependent cyclodipeptide synthase